jgi:hypothetical protein
MPAAVVLIFTRTDCPISNRYAPEVQRLHEKFTSRDVRFYLVYPNPDVTVPQIRKHLEDYSYTMTALRDPRHRLVDTVRATFTPEAVVFVPGALSGGRSEPRLVYKGRIDDRFVDFGKARPAATTRDLEQKLEAILSGEPVSLTTTPGIGCLIRDLK